MAQCPGVHFQQVYDDYIAQLRAKSKKKQFIGDIEIKSRNASLDDLQQSVDTLVQRCADRKLQRWLVRFVVPVATQIKEYSQALDQIITPQPAKIVWGGLRIVAECLVRYASVLEKIESVLLSLGDHLWVLNTCDKLYATSAHSAPTVQQIVGRSYVHIIDLWYRVTKELRRHPLVGLSRQVWKDDKIANALDAIKEDADELHRISSVVEAELASHTRDDIADIKHDLSDYKASIDIETIALREERKRAEVHRQKVEAELKALREKSKEQEFHRQVDQSHRLVESLREDSSHEAHLLHKFTQNRHPGTCQWLFQLPEYEAWASDQCVRPVLWLHGKHGSGKSFLCSAAVNGMKCSPDALCTACFFITKGRDISRTILLRSLAYQIVQSAEARSGPVSGDIASLIRSSSMDPFRFERIINRVLMDIPFMCIFIDGLDEASDVPGLVHVIGFLKHECQQRKGKVRLWLSSQYSPDIEKYIHHKSEDIISEIRVQEKDTNSDIERFLKHELPDSVQNADTLSKLIITQSLNGDAQGSFLWVAQMIQDLKQRAESSEDMLQLARKGLPSSMHDYYKAVIARYRARQAFDMPLWKIILSILTFVRRPMKLHEIREAIAVARLKPDHNIRATNLVFLSKIMSECVELVDVLNSGDSLEKGTMALSHLAVHNFLRSHTGLGEDQCEHEDCVYAEPIVSEDILRDICMQYLLQPRYSQLLVRHDQLRFTSGDDSDLEEHRLVYYAAKYWYRHCGEVAPSERVAIQISRFLESANFRTCLQIQSIALIGHFVIDYDPVDGRPVQMIKNLPTWINQHWKSLDNQYNCFLREWCHVLQLGLTPQFSGQIDRVFWPGLGQHNFLNDGHCRYSCFRFDESLSPDSVCRMNFPDEQNTHQLICELRQTSNGVKVSLDRWRVDVEVPKITCRREYSIDLELDKKSNLVSPCAMRRSIIPRTEVSISDGTIRLLNNGRILAIGRHMFHLSATKEKPVEIKTGNDDMFEEACQSDDVLVLCRRKHPKRHEEYNDYNERSSGKLVEEGRRRKTEHAGYHKSKYADSEDDSEDSSSDTSEMRDDAEIELVSDAERSSDTASLEDRHSDRDTDSSRLLDDGSDDESESSFSASRTTSGDDSSELEFESPQSSTDFEMSGDSSDQETAETDEFHYPVSISAIERNINCNGCEKHLKSRWYTCNICGPEQGFNLCSKCVSDGQKWCRDKHHQLVDLACKQPVGVISWSNSIIQHQLKVFRHGSSEPILSFQDDEQDMLHESPPCLHPFLPIVAWPISRERLLLADYSLNVWTVHEIHTSSRISQIITMSIKFSADGIFLHVAALEAARVFSKRNEATCLAQNHHEVSLTVATFLLKSKELWKRRPRLLTRHHHVIGIWRQPFFRQIPWAWTWAINTVYLAINGLRLHLFKAELSGSKFGIYVPREVVFLPHSAQNRSVQYFEPQNSGGKSLLMIGPHYEPEPQPALAVYLGAEDLGPWLNVKDVPIKHGKRHKLEKRCKVEYEDFDMEDDCDIIPLDLDR